MDIWNEVVCNGCDFKYWYSAPIALIFAFCSDMMSRDTLLGDGKFQVDSDLSGI